MFQANRKLRWRRLTVAVLCCAALTSIDACGEGGERAGRDTGESAPAAADEEDPGSPFVAGSDQMAALLARGAPKRILFFTVDALSANRCSLYGHPRLTTPALEKLAEQAVVFDNAIAPAPWTYPSYASQLTSRHSPTTMGYKGLRIPRSEITIAEYLHELGYLTAGFIDNQYLYEKFGMAQGYDHYEEYNKSHRKALHRARAWAQEHPDQPFFLFVHTNDVHGPYVPSEPWKRIFDDDAHFGARQEVRVLENKLPHVFGAMPRYQKLEGRTDANFYRARYDAAIRETDFEFERLVRAIEAHGDFEDTVIIFSADHGESMGNHDFFFNHGLVYEDIIRVPLVIRLPNGRHGGKRIATQVSLLDLLPTILGLVETKPRKKVAGKSLLPLIEGQTKALHPHVFASQGIFDQFMVRTDEWKLIKLIPGSAEQKQAWRTFPGADLDDPDKVFWELYRHQDDPAENTNLVEKFPEIKKALAAKLEEWMSRPEDYRTESVELDPDDLERLREIGYIE